MTVFQGHKSVKQCRWKGLCDYVKTLYDCYLPQLDHCFDFLLYPREIIYVFPDLTETLAFSWTLFKRGLSNFA